MKVKALLLAPVLAVAVLIPLWAYDFGGTIDNSTTITVSDGTTFLQEDKLALWFETPIGASLDFAAQGSYTYTSERAYLFDVDFLWLRGSFLLGQAKRSQLGFRAGRFLLSEFTKLVLSDNIDGLELSWHTAKANTSLAVGYTGLQLDPVSTISITWADENDEDLLAPPRLVGSLQARFPEAIRRQDLLVSILLQQDLRPEDELIQEGEVSAVTGRGGRLSSQYFGLGLAGPLAGSLYYDAFTYLETGTTLSYIEGVYEYAPIVAVFSGVTVRWFAERLLNSKAELRLVYSSGDEDFADLFTEGNRADRANVFVPISRQELAVAFSPRLGNLLLLEAQYSLKPVAALQTLLKGILFLRPTTGPISDPRVDPATESKYLGTEIDGVVNFRPLSDLGTSLSLGLFLPMGGAFRDSYQEAEFRGKLQISFSF
jgi:hypothetical protein